MTSHRPQLRMQATTRDQTVSPLELFFDLVFVFALTQVTALMAGNITPHGLARGLLIVALLWWCWIGYAWLCNLVRADEGHLRLIMLAAMGVMFIAALAIPEAFDDLPGGLPGPVVIAVCYFLIRLIHLVLFWAVAAGDPGLRRQLVRFTPSVLGGTALLLVASQFTGGTQTALWAAALAVDYLGTFLGGASGWRVRSPGHFAERFGLIIIVALGESIVAIGVGVAKLPISWPIVVASALGLAVSSGLWWAYFDTAAIYAEHEFARAAPEKQVRLGRDAYTYMHFPMMAGIVMLALGLKKVLEYVGDTEHHELTDPLKGVPLLALFAGVAVYLLGQVGFKWLLAHELSVLRLVAAAVLLVAIPLVTKLPALGQLAVVAVTVVALIVTETILYAEKRREIRANYGHH